jgi:hypothetical protein
MARLRGLLMAFGSASEAGFKHFVCPTGWMISTGSIGQPGARR